MSASDANSSTCSPKKRKSEKDDSDFKFTIGSNKCATIIRGCVARRKRGYRDQIRTRKQQNHLDFK
eukprot:6192007-Pleurochrysis_carterae.AAC.1